MNDRDLYDGASNDGEKVNLTAERCVDLIVTDLVAIELSLRLHCLDAGKADLCDIRLRPSCRELAEHGTLVIDEPRGERQPPG